MTVPFLIYLTFVNLFIYLFIVFKIYLTWLYRLIKALSEPPSCMDGDTGPHLSFSKMCKIVLSVLADMLDLHRCIAHRVVTPMLYIVLHMELLQLPVIYHYQ